LQNANSLTTPAAEQIFVRVMAPYILGNNGPKATGLVPGTDSLVTDQSRLTYSFNYKNDHFVIINTDPAGRDWQVPYHWIGNDVQTARNNCARHIFAFGHKPAYPSSITPTDGLNMYYISRDNLWESLENNRCEAMFSAHNHVWDHSQPNLQSTWQVVAGNGGSPPNSGWTPDNKPPYYGYTLVNIYTNGEVIVESMGRDVDPNNFTVAAPQNPTTLRYTINATLPTVINHIPLVNTPLTGPFTIEAQILDNSGIPPIAKLIYTVNNGVNDTISASSISCSNYTFTIPVQSDSGFINYKIIASATTEASAPSDTTSYIFSYGINTGDNFLIYPNPTTGNVTVIVPSSSGVTGITLFSINGKKIREWPIAANALEINIADLLQGVYLLSLQNSSGKKLVKKIVKH